MRKMFAWKFFEAIEKRRSIRKYSDKKVPAEVMNKAIDAALLAPNSSNMQTWQFHWVRTEAKKKIIGKSLFRSRCSNHSPRAFSCFSKASALEKDF